jgi:hypothetical protein
MAGTVTYTREDINGVTKGKIGEKLTIVCTADAANGSFPATSLTGLRGWVLKVITKPGGTTPTANYDIALNDPDATSLDAFGGALANRAASTQEQVAPVLSGATTPVFLNGDYSLALTNNSVNSAVVTIYMYIVNQ